MDLPQSIILGLIQGTTEWLPISSTGHLRIAEHFFGLTVPLLFDVLLHSGTLLVTLIYFRNDIKNILVSLFKRDFSSSSGKLILPIIVGTIPTALIAVGIGDTLDSYFSSLFWLGVWFIITGIFLYATKYTTEYKGTISIPAALLIGFMQGLSVIPSVSRSGFTIATMLFLGIRKELAFKYSFLLSIPSIIGALGYTLIGEHNELTTSGINTVEIAAAIAVTMAVSFLALKILEKSLAAKKFYLFSIYCLVIGIIMLILNFSGF